MDDDPTRSPRLQNVPVRTTQGRSIRQAFVPEGALKTLTAAVGWAQLEERILKQHATSCIDPETGARARERLGRALCPSLIAHLAACMACALERASFDAMYTPSGPPTSLRRGLVDQIVAVALRARKQPRKP